MDWIYLSQLNVIRQKCWMRFQVLDTDLPLIEIFDKSMETERKPIINQDIVGIITMNYVALM